MERRATDGPRTTDHGPRTKERIEPMRIERIDLRIVRLPLVRPFRTSSSRKDHLDHILVRVEADGRTGWGECASPSDPYYCPETTETCWHILKDFLAPAVLGRDWSTIEELVGLYRLVKGNRFARAGLEMAGWDLLARSQEIAPSYDDRRHTNRDPLGRQPGDRGAGRDALRSDRSIPRGRIPADQAEDRARLGCRRGPARPGTISIDRRSRSTPTRPTRSTTCRRSRRSTPSTCS